jgi:hypothetical protein
MAQKRALAFGMLVYWLAEDQSRDLALYTQIVSLIMSLADFRKQKASCW